MGEIDAVRLNFNPQSLWALNAIIGLVMFGVALELKPRDFRAVLVTPKPVLIGLAAQFVLLPALTFGLVLAIRPAPSVALGMMLVAACPGGNVSNFLTHYARGNTALSVSMTAVSTAVAIVMTPLNLALWAGLYAPTASILRSVSLDPLDMLLAVALLLGVPMVAGMSIGHRFPRLVARVHRPVRAASLLIFGLFVVGALAANWRHFLDWVGVVVFAVFLHNATALASGWAAARAAGLPERDRRAVAIEVGIQNSALGLILIFNFFGGLGGMAIVTAWWGVWHLISGLTVATWWSRRDPGPAA
ncbi:bile acid:sodium symporter family protein [Azohydromonas sp.]|uniref:bile acid:sodium symporter family protein n=1 Tax=Azohydromonas sp. TaxID=1872666 RepID=UPI002CD42681|nr:bile acid:sodium symporter family protein [Azohydromonas sp.]HMM87335.1 bile acid:sodium symporter family protein [Azohydromonas sp.]